MTMMVWVDSGGDYDVSGEQCLCGWAMVEIVMSVENNGVGWQWWRI